ncbi:hypothetical protein AVEN_224489-2 [Araneus ventricosus]|uniref:Mutator-like transposase domain-containing protein n=1 Tax=Araneus ventricosus TaxID=182803 RepID=A0A4Y2L8A0_ARAVE|nr:hypothetical protein AVEN_224489-2 [Araneus ventricosus]
MDTVSRRYRKLKGRPSKRKRLCASNISKRWEKNKVENSAISVGAENCLSNEVLYDGIWQKRRHTSLYGIGIVVDILTGIVIDYEILSKYFPGCTTVESDLGEQSADFLHLFYEAHKPECSENYVGSSNAMEVKAAEILWTRSVENCDKWMETGTLKRGASRSEIQTIYSADTKITVDQPGDDDEKVQRCHLYVTYWPVQVRNKLGFVFKKLPISVRLRRRENVPSKT